MKVYTKTGDKGTTLLIGGKRVPKYHKRIEAYGTVDELMAYTGLLYDQLQDDKLKKLFLQIQDKLMTCATHLATDSKTEGQKLPSLFEADIEKLEYEIDKIEKTLPKLTSFILPGGHTTVSFCHIARTVCRRAERLAIVVNEDIGNADMVVKYLNRLSDFYFVLSRKLTIDLNCKEINWIPCS
jgi:cob(I)alamin adenosyltransferase